VTAIHEKEEVVSGEYSGDAPDLYLEMADYSVISYPLFLSSNQLFEDQIEGHSANHDRDGILFIHGGAVQSTDVAADLVDITPTILSVLGCKPPSHLDGEPVDVFSTSFDVKPPQDRELSAVDF